MVLAAAIGCCPARTFAARARWPMCMASNLPNATTMPGLPCRSSTAGNNPVQELCTLSVQRRCVACVRACMHVSSPEVSSKVPHHRSAADCANCQRSILQPGVASLQPSIVRSLEQILLCRACTSAVTAICIGCLTVQLRSWNCSCRAPMPCHWPRAMNSIVTKGNPVFLVALYEAGAAMMHGCLHKRQASL